jgi:hypothetical protein
MAKQAAVGVQGVADLHAGKVSRCGAGGHGHIDGAHVLVAQRGIGMRGLEDLGGAA